ncbi:MAG: methyltransferase domain-containing protein [Xanthomonadales bacterium]|nr:methyltransferase domain-containing protein [Xanthomonadales bacterium]
MSESDRKKWDERYQKGAYAERTHPSPLLQAWVDRIPRGRALDVACGAGRNALFLATEGFEVDAVDISAEALQRGRQLAEQSGLKVNWIRHDLDEPLSVDPGYVLIVVTRYVNLPLIRQLTGSVEPGGFLICEEHLRSDANVGGPTNPAFRVVPGSLKTAAGDLRIRFFDEGVLNDPDGRPMALARLVAQHQ